MADASTTILDNLKVNIPDLSGLPLTTEIRHIDRTAGKVLDQMPSVMLRLGLGIALIIMGWVISGWLAAKLNRLLVRARMEATLAAFLGSTLRYVMFFTIFVAALTVVGVSSTTLAALLGAIGLAVGLAVKGTLGHVASGMMLMVHRPLKVGDWVENTTTSGTTTVSGTVKRIGMFSTEINTQEFVRVFIPNTLLWENILRNHSYNRMRMLKLSFGLGYEVDIRKAFDVVRATLAANALVLKTPEPVVAVDSFGDAGVVCLLHVWVRTEDRSALRNIILLEVMEALKAHGHRMAHQPVSNADSAAMGPDGDTAVLQAALQKDAKVGDSEGMDSVKAPARAARATNKG